MPSVSKKSLDSPDEQRTADKTKVNIVKVGDVHVARSELQPGWRWSEALKPTVGGDSCQFRHVGYVLSGNLTVAHDDGTQGEVGPGDAYVVEPGHDAWVSGSEPFVALEFESRSAADYGKPS